MMTSFDPLSLKEGPLGKSVVLGAVNEPTVSSAKDPFAVAISNTAKAVVPFPDIVILREVAPGALERT